MGAPRSNSAAAWRRARRGSLSWGVGGGEFSRVGAARATRRHFLPATRAQFRRKGADLFDQSGQRLAVGIVGGRGGGLLEQFAEAADFAVRMRKQAGDLGLQRAGVDDLAQRGVGAKRQQVAGNIESTS